MIDDVLDRLFDYAGMFPPASLDFEDALRESGTFPASLRRPSMVLSDMVVTPDVWRRMDDDAFAAADYRRVCTICIVGVAATEAADLVREVVAWNRHAGVATPPRRVTNLEVHIDDGLGLGTIDRHITTLRHLLSDGDIRLYVEPKWSDAMWQERLPELMTFYRTLLQDTELPTVGLKFRCAGPTALRPETVAKVIAAAVPVGMPLKATQGLHHPVVEDRYQNAIGFLGLVSALRLHAAVGLEEDDLVRCLTERDIGAFSFADGIRWRDHHASQGQVGQAMAQTFSIGTCSLREPDDDLARLVPAS